MPSCGKTTIIKKIVEELQKTGKKNIRGFYTAEFRKSGERIGFDVHTICENVEDEEVEPLARIKLV